MKTVQITRKGLFIWAGLFFFIAGWMFVLGILVGRGTAPVTLNMDRLEKELVELKSALLEKENAQLESPSDRQNAATTKLGFYEALKQVKPKEVFKVDAPQRRPESPEEVKGKASPDPKPAQSHAAPASAPSRAAATVDSHHDVPEPAKAPTKAPKTAEGRFSVQVAAFKNAANAERLVASLKTDGFPAYQIQTPLDGGSRFLYRVRVGAFEDRRAAEQMLVRLQGRKVKGLVVATP